MNIDLKVDKDTLVVNEKKLFFDYNIRKVEVLEELLIILLGVPFDVSYLDNVFAVTKEGDIAWRVQSLGEVYPMENRLPYEHMNIDEFKQIVVSDFYGRRFFINPQDGKIIGRDFVK